MNISKMMRGSSFEHRLTSHIIECLVITNKNNSKIHYILKLKKKICLVVPDDFKEVILKRIVYSKVKKCTKF
jgi:predicted protein tyrosine phosphatase